MAAVYSIAPRSRMGKKIIFAIIVCFLSLLGLFSSYAFAQESSEEKPSQEIDSSIIYMPASSLKEGPGKISVNDSEFEYSYEFRVAGKLPLKLSLDAEQISIDNKTGIELPAQLTGLTFGLETTFTFFNLPKAYLRLGISPSFFGDSWDFASRDFRLPYRFYGIYKVNDNLLFLAGVALYPKFEKSVLPVLGLIYRPNDRLAFNIIPERPNISYALSDRITLFSEADLSFDESTVNINNQKNAVLRYGEAHLGAGVQYKINKFLQLSFSGGNVFTRSLRYRNIDGKVAPKNGPYAGIRLEAKL